MSSDSVKSDTRFWKKVAAFLRQALCQAYHNCILRWCWHWSSPGLLLFRFLASLSPTYILFECQGQILDFGYFISAKINFLVCGAGDRIQDLVDARQAFYQWPTPHSQEKYFEKYSQMCHLCCVNNKQTKPICLSDIFVGDWFCWLHVHCW
jgi:hypothetical protein